MKFDKKKIKTLDIDIKKAKRRCSCYDLFDTLKNKFTNKVPLLG